MENNNINRLKTIYKTLSLGKDSYYKTHLTIVNSILADKLSPTEIIILAEFMSLEGILSEFRFGPSAKKVVRSNLDDMSTASLSNHMGNLFDKGYLIKTGDIISIHKRLLPFEDEQFYHFKIIKLPDNANTGTE